MVAIGTGEGPPDLEAGIRIAETDPDIYATVGIHPHDAAKATDDIWPGLIALAAHPKVVGIGEIGLDYHYDFSPRVVQREVFIRQLVIAGDTRRIVIIHTREAWDDTVAVLKEHWAPTGLGGIFHCFSGDAAQAVQALDLGFHISYSGIVTFPRAVELHEAVRQTPLDRMLVETDSPYLAPIPYRGKRNEPSYVVETARHVASLLGRTYEEVAEATTLNWRRLCLQDTATKS